MGRGLRRSAVSWSVVGGVGFLLLPWYAAERDLAPAVFQVASFGRPWLLLPGVLLLASLATAVLTPVAVGRPLVILGAVGFLGTLAQGFAIGLSQPGMGVGALVVLAAFLLLCSTGLAARGFFRGDAFVAGAVVATAVLVGLFTFFPVARILMSAAQADSGAFSVQAVLERLATAKI